MAKEPKWGATSEGDLDPETLELLHPEGLERVARLPNLTEGLLSREYSERAVEKILGANFLRVCAE